MKRIILLLVPVFILAGCNNKEKISVDGVVSSKAKGTIYLSRVDVDRSVFIDSAKIRRNGHFHFNINSKNTDFYQLGISNNDFITLLAVPGEKISLSFPGKTLYERYIVSGSEGSQKLQYLDIKLAETKKKLDSISSEYSKATGKSGLENARAALQNDYFNLMKEQRKSNIEFIINNITSLASIKAIYQKLDPQTYVLYEPRDLQYMKIVTDSLKKYYTESKHVKALVSDFEKEMSQMYTNQLEQMTKDLPQVKLDPTLADINGRKIALSSLKGKYVLLTFWSVLSQDCITENLQFKEIYKLYNKKGFEIYQINLDDNEANWKAAVKFDELPWISTREDFNIKPGNAALFNVRSLPSNFLFGKDGTILASNLHGRQLLIKLEQLFNN